MDSHNVRTRLTSVDSALNSVDLFLATGVKACYPSQMEHEQVMRWLMFALVAASVYFTNREYFWFRIIATLLGGTYFLVWYGK